MDPPIESPCGSNVPQSFRTAPDVLRGTARDFADRRCNSCVTGWAGQPLLERGERIDQFGSLERPIAPAHCDLPQNTGIRQTLHRLAGGLERPIGGPCCARCREDGHSGQCLDQVSHRGVAPRWSDALDPRCLEFANARYKPPGVLDRSPACRREQGDPSVDACHRLRRVRGTDVAGTH